MSSSLRATATGHGPGETDWGGGMSTSCKPRVQLFLFAGCIVCCRYH